ncbi:MAG: 6,7-dimethyl-8-ribityllumazine synthase [Rhodospirillales bacterium]|nr:6,7-dimethyl-8-ribityllumazine synthase [Rhodospirillales bacterium]
MIPSPRVLIIEARFYEDLADQLVTGALHVLASAGAVIERRAVPGCFELPAAIAFALGASAEDGAYDGFVALGCVIRGETDHYDHICREVSRALMDLSVQRQVALGFGVLTCQTYEQAFERADINGQNKGADAAEACLRMIALKRLGAGAREA